ncbi:MAG: FAD-binding protein [Phycisphaerae bacterium]
MFDLAIVGAGPAGATLARLVGNRFRLILIDRRRLSAPGASGPGSLEKCCGGLVAPDAQRVLAEMGLGLPDSVLAGPQLFAVRSIDLDSGLERFYQRHYINIDREAFDRWLVSLVPGGVDVRDGCLLRGFTYEPGRGEAGDGGDAFTIRFTRNGRECVAQARVLIGADGADSRVRKLARGDDAGRRECRSYIAIQEWFRAESPLPYFTAVFDSTITDFYGWTIPKDGCLLAGVAVEPGPAALRRFDQFKRKLSDMGFDLSRPVKRCGAALLRPRGAGEIFPVVSMAGAAGDNPSPPGVALIGEAAGWISPSSAEGFSYAFRSAIAAAEALRAASRRAMPAASEFRDQFLRGYRANCSSLRWNIRAKSLKSRIMYSPHLRKLIMKCGIGSIRILDGSTSYADRRAD